MQQERTHNPSDQIMLAAASAQEHRMRLPQYNGDQVMKCPRCDSLNTKFCYYNNYSLTQPRHFCKSCKRYWTKGGTLRNVPVGGGCRKNKRIKQRAATAHDQVAAASSVSDQGDEAIISSLRGAGGSFSSSSSPLQHNFSADAGEYRHGLAFEMPDQTTRAVSVSNPLIIVNWAAVQEPSGTASSENLLTPSDSNVLALTLAENLNKDVSSKRLQNARELSQLRLLAPSTSSLSDTTLAPYNFCLEGIGDPASNEDMQWRLPPRLVTMAEEGEVTNGRSFMQILEQDLTGIYNHESLRHSDHASFEVAAGDSLAGYWTSGSWAPDMTVNGMAGSQLI